MQEGEREGKSLIDAMADGVLEGMQTFDDELERLINAGRDRPRDALSYATNRTNLQLRLETQGSARLEDRPSAHGRQARSPAGSGAQPAPAPAGARRDDLDDLIER